MMEYGGARRLSHAGMMLAVLTLAACGQIGNPLQAIRGNIPPPDEFQVITRKPIEIPSSTALPEPTPGAPSPLDPDPHGDAVRALMGESGSAAMASSETSAGENVLLSAADAAAANSEIRVQLEADKVSETAGKPYKPPSLASVLGLTDGEPEVDKKELLDPLAESQRLQTAGVAAPANPDAAPESEPVPEAPSIYPIPGQVQRKPLASVAPGAVPAN